MKKYEIYVNCMDDNACEIAFSSGKGYCGVGFSDGNVHRFYVVGKWSDAVRVYSALKNNNYKCKIVEMKND